MDRYFLALRVGSAVTAVVWVLALAAPAAVASGGALTAAFIAYSFALYLWVWRHPERRARAYLAALPVDLVFLFLVCLWSAEPLSGVYLAFYLVVALHAFYFGAPVGIAAAAGFAALYAALYLWLPPAERCEAQELFLRLGFAFLIAISLGLISIQRQADRRRLSEVNRQLQHRNRILEQTYRHLSIGRLAADVAHNINNPAAIIVSKVELMSRRARGEGLPQAFVEDLGTVAEHAFRIARVVRSLVALSPRHEGPTARIDLAKLAEGVVPLFENRAAERRVRIERRLTPGLGVRAHESALRQVIVNLLANALDAVGDGGAVAVEARRGPEVETVELRVHDDGPGIAGEHVDDIFSPFFTTKNGAEGVGLGLSLSLTSVRRVGGSIAVESTPGRGSVFTVTLPADSHGDGLER